MKLKNNSQALKTLYSKDFKPEVLMSKDICSGLWERAAEKRSRYLVLSQATPIDPSHMEHAGDRLFHTQLPQTQQTIYLLRPQIF